MSTTNVQNEKNLDEITLEEKNVNTWDIPEHFELRSKRQKVQRRFCPRREQ
jgi:hypothetical protein